MSENPLQDGKQAPDFAAVAHTGDTISLHDFVGKQNVVLFFYPKADTPG